MTDVQREPHDAPHAPDSTTEYGSHSHAGHADMFRRRFWWSLLLTVPVVVTSPMVMDWFGYQLDFTGMYWIGPVLGSVIFFWCCWVFLSGAWAEIQQRSPPPSDGSTSSSGGSCPLSSRSCCSATGWR